MRKQGASKFMYRAFFGMNDPTSLSSLRIGFPRSFFEPCSFRTHQNTDLAATETYHENGYDRIKEILWPPVSLSIKLPFFLLSSEVVL